LSKISERLSAISAALGPLTDENGQPRFTQPLDFVVDELGLQLDAIETNTPMNSELNSALKTIQVCFWEVLIFYLFFRKSASIPRTIIPEKSTKFTRH
jgi:hypothetical protein